MEGKRRWTSFHSTDLMEGLDSGNYSPRTGLSMEGESKEIKSQLRQEELWERYARKVWVSFFLILSYPIFSIDETRYEKRDTSHFHFIHINIDCSFPSIPILPLISSSISSSKCNDPNASNAR